MIIVKRIHNLFIVCCAIFILVMLWKILIIRLEMAYLERQQDGRDKWIAFTEKTEWISD
jgi:hypothetical protein